MFLDIFGREDGWMVYKEVKLALRRAQVESNSDNSRILSKDPKASRAQCKSYSVCRKVDRLLQAHE